MKITVLVAAALMLPAALAQAQESTLPPPPQHASSSQDDRWPGAKTFGIRAGFGGSTDTPGINVGNVGLKVLLTDSLALKADLGLGIVSSAHDSSSTFALDAGLDIYLGDEHRSLRPYIPLFFGLGVVNNNGNNGLNNGSQFQIALGAGFGAEYFFAKQFSVSAELVLGIHFVDFDPVTVAIGTATPGVFATYYF